jgi:ribose-phosphate pyrophosphokinase
MSSNLKHDKKFFITPEWFADEQTKRMEPPRGKLLITSCRSGAYLAGRVVDRYHELLSEAGSQENVLYLENIDRQFSDSEICVRLEQHVGGYDVFLIQALFDPNSNRSVDQNYIALLIAVRALREHGAGYITAVVPYLAYSRQDKPTRFMREPTTAKLMADLSFSAGIDRLISWHPHSGQIHGFYGSTPVNMLSPLNFFIEEFSRFKNRNDVIIIAPDVGASKFVTHVGRELKINSAIASKFRPHPEEVITTEIIGDFENKKIGIILDDMMSSAGTIYSLIKKLVKEKGIEEIYIGVSHNLGVGDAFDRLTELNASYNLNELIVTNSVPQTERFESLQFVKVRCLSDILSRTINRIHYNRSVSEIFYES